MNSSLLFPLKETEPTTVLKATEGAEDGFGVGASFPRPPTAV